MSDDPIMKAWRRAFHTTDTGPATCPWCGKKNVAASDMTGHRAPRPGDIAVCIGCGGVTIYDQGLRLRKPTAGEMTRIAADPRIGPHLTSLQRAVRGG